MSKDNSEMKGVQQFDNFRKLISIIDKLRDSGLNEHISLPRIAVLGSQSSGKSSLLEYIVGMNFLPRGSGVVTRRPLELRLVHVQSKLDGPYAIFEVEKSTKLTDFDKVRDKIQELTDKACGKSKGIVDDPIILNVYSNSCPDLTLIDLPGITRIAVSGQDDNIEAITKNMAERYCADERTIILAVVPANQDMSISDGLQMARRLDPEGIRTIGCITKIDIMDRGTNAKRMLMNEEIPLALGFVGIKGRSQQDIDDNIQVKAALELEKKFFASHSIYSSLPAGRLGTGSQVQTQTTTMYKHIRRILPNIIREIDEKIFDCEDNIGNMGNPMPLDESERLKMLWEMISVFCERFKCSVLSYYSNNIKKHKQEFMGGAKIKMMFNDLYMDYLNPNYKASKKYTDKNVKHALRIHQGDSLPGFVTSGAFLSLTMPLMDNLKEPAHDCMNEVHNCLESVALALVEESFSRFPSLVDEIGDCIQNVIADEKEATKIIMNTVLNSETGYLFTKDPEYISLIYTGFEEKKTDDKKKAVDNDVNNDGTNQGQQDQQGQQGQQGEQGQQEKVQEDNKGSRRDKSNNLDRNDASANKKLSKKEIEKKLIQDIKNRIDCYFAINVKQMADMIPKLIGHYLIMSSLKHMHFKVYSKISSSDVFNMLQEPEHIAAKRQTLNKMLEILRNSRKILLRDPDLAYSLSHLEKSSTANREKSKNSPAKKKKATEETQKSNFDKAKDITKNAGTKVGETAKTAGIAVGNTWSSGVDKLKDTFATNDKPVPTKSPEKKPVSIPQQNFQQPPKVHANQWGSSNVVPTQNINMPNQNINNPSQNINMPSQNIINPSQNINMPSQNIINPSQNNTAWNMPQPNQQQMGGNQQGQTHWGNSPSNQQQAGWNQGQPQQQQQQQGWGFQGQQSQQQQNLQAGQGGFVANMQQKFVDNTSKVVGNQVEKNLQGQMNNQIDQKKNTLFNANPNSASNSNKNIMKPQEQKPAPQKRGFANLFGN